jgi:hypothetical protein
MLVRIVLGLVGMLVAACALEREPSRTPRTAIEELLLSHAISRSMTDLTIPLERGTSLAVEVAGFLPDRAFVEGGETTSLIQGAGTSRNVYAPGSELLMVLSLFQGRLGELGFLVQHRREDAKYLVRVLVQALGTVQGESFFGMPAVQSVVIPVALPALSIFRLENQKAHMRFTMNIFDAATGRLVRSTPWYSGSAYYDQYTVLILFFWRLTDLVLSP